MSRESGDNRDLLKLAAETHPGMACVVGDAQILYVNAAALAHLGYAGSELIGRDIRELVHPEHYESVRRHSEAPTANTAAANHPLRLLRSDGSSIQVQATLTPFQYGDHPALMITAIDPTSPDNDQRREALLIEQTPLAVIEWDTQFRVTRWNRAAQQIFGFTSAEMLGKHADQIVPEDQRSHVHETWAQLMRQSGGIRSTNDNIDKNGHRLVCEWYNSPLVDESGTASGVISLVQNVTERHHAEQALRRQRNLYSALSETNQTIIRLTDPDELFQKVCRIAVDYGSFTLAWIGQVDTATQWVHPVAHYGEGVEYIRQLKISADPNRSEGQGPTGRCIHEARPIITDDFLEQSATKPWHQAAIAAGLRSSAAFPIEANGRVIAVFNVYADQTSYFTDDLVALLEEMASDISFALDNFERERERAMTRAERDRLVAILEATPDLVGVADPSGKSLYYNAGAKQMLGINEANEQTRGSIYGNHSPAAAKRLRDEILPIAAAQGTWKGETTIRNTQGEEIPISQIVIAHRDRAGKVTHYSTIARDIRDIKQAEARIAHLAFYDGLTELPNRRLLQDRLRQDLIRAQRLGFVGTVLYIDLDRFKTINDSLGQAAGDALLKQVAQRLLAELRAEDTLARVGSDEFVIVLADIGEDREEAALNAESIARAIEATLARPFLIMDHEIHCGGSIGIAFFPDEGDAVTPEAVLRHADTAMNRAKSEGGAAIQYYMPAMQAAARRRLQLEQDLRHALEKDQLVLHFQPQVDVISGAVVGAEALLRWAHPERGLVPPIDFIPLAEETGIILALGSWVLHTALQHARQWVETGLCNDSGGLAVNVSPRQFHQSDFVDQVAQALQETGVPAACLKLEITEGVVINDIADTREKMQALKELGVGVAIDDFGTGYSSLAYLKRLPLDVLKIDKSFVSDIPNDPNDAAIVETILAMAQHLGLQVVAEGVETEAQLQFLRDNGCGTYQGYYCSRPLPAADYTAFLATHGRRS